MWKYAFAAITAILLPTTTTAQEAKDYVQQHIEARSERYDEVAQMIWDFAEVGYQETESSALLQAELAEAGFEVEPGVAEIPTAFIASYGQGSPVIAILAEFDALPGFSQDRVPTKQPLPQISSSHSCGHHLFGAGSVASAIAVKAWMEETGMAGTIRLYGTPAEEGGAGKVYLVRAGLFEDVDVTLHWHPADLNSAAAYSTLANRSAKFRFHGVSAHAAAAPDRGRSALDGVEAMNDMVNMLREHVPQETRIHYVITSGGSAPNVTPDFAEVFYYVRHPDPRILGGIFDRVVKTAEGAALGTGTEIEYEIIHGVYPLLPNETLSEAVQANLEVVGGVQYDETDRRFAELIQGSFDNPPPLSQAAAVAPFMVFPGAMPGSTDVGDVSWVTPTAGVVTATWVPGTAAHSWQAAAAGGTGIGNKGMMAAAKVLAMTAIDLLADPELVTSAKEELLRRVGQDFEYAPLVGDRDPPLDYRLNQERGGL